jgi:hypothetical protein
VFWVYSGNGNKGRFMDKAYNLKVRQLIFDERGLLFIVRCLERDESYCYTVSELFTNDELLAEFCAIDIRLISYFAAMEDYRADQKFLNKSKKPPNN